MTVQQINLREPKTLVLVAAVFAFHFIGDVSQTTQVPQTPISKEVAQALACGQLPNCNKCSGVRR